MINGTMLIASVAVPHNNKIAESTVGPQRHRQQVDMISPKPLSHACHPRCANGGPPHHVRHPQPPATASKNGLLQPWEWTTTTIHIDQSVPFNQVQEITAAPP